MTFIITLIALIIERFFDWSHMRKWQWFNTYHAWLIAKASRFSPYVLIVMCVLPPVLLVGFLDGLLRHYSFFKLIFGTLILIYCLGPNNFWAQVYACIKVLHNEDPQVAMSKVQTEFGITLSENPQAFHRAFTNTIFIEANRRIFAVFFWFVLLGPVGAVLYRLVDLCKLRGVTIKFVANQTQEVLDWLPVRILAFGFALGGHFTEVVRHWKHGVLSAPVTNDFFLTECGIAALDILELQQLPIDGSAEKETLGLLDRTFVISLVLLAMGVLVV
ncbi:MAG: regulatory signaling modulator protein AmpE [Gammaproteobacteria bacterium]|nr:regulatory signaling modulator protein AmpE [Gammaproteobacteria bacterium]